MIPVLSYSESSMHLQIEFLEFFEKLTQPTWNKVYRDKGLKGEKIHSIAALKNIEALYSFRVSKSIRGIGFRENHFLRVLLIEPDHDAAYGKK